MTRVFTTGVFDLFHVGHLRSLRKAASLGDQLIVGVATDELAASYKRVPVIPFAQRCEIIRHIDCVDEQIVDEGVYPPEFYQQHRIDLHCQGSEVPGIDFYAVARELGILRILGRDPTIDTTQIINLIVDSYSDTI
ncbi:adenylyltransferase/cytidyltransferase family protein [Aeoliella sp.]|uniref:adenylyltransferase/cytidyltransferase family protein n=1 Tax=Aeoliella sp. TaxID=2795800 RepID=UPI003CCBFDCC